MISVGVQASLVTHVNVSCEFVRVFECKHGYICEYEFVHVLNMSIYVCMNVCMYVCVCESE